MAKFKIIFEDNAVTCRPTKKFIGIKEKEWPRDWSIERRKKYVEVLVNADSEKQALNLGKNIYKSSKGFHVWHGEVVSTGGSFEKNK